MAVFRSDPCGIVCLIITYAAVLYADYVVVRHLVIPTMSDTLWGVVNVVAFNLIIFLLTMSHMRAVLSDPGIVPLPTTGLDFSDLHAGKTMPNMRDGWTVCMKCETYRPPRAHHCRICRRCIRRMDHHCPWINNCVGEFNQKYFIQFLFYVGILSAYATTMVVVSWMMDPGVKGNGKHVKFFVYCCVLFIWLCTLAMVSIIIFPVNLLPLNPLSPLRTIIDSSRSMIHSVLLVVESLLFGMFVIAIGCDQMGAILSDETAVEHVKKEGPRRQKKSSYALMQEVFGRGHPCWWLVPLQFHPVVQVYETQYTV